MTFIENEQWVIALYRAERGALGQARPGGRDRAADAPGAHHQVQGRLGRLGHGRRPGAGRRQPAQHPADAAGAAGGAAASGWTRTDLFIAAGARGVGAIYTDYGGMVHIIRKVFMRVSAKLDWLILKLH